MSDTTAVLLTIVLGVFVAALAFVGLAVLIYAAWCTSTQWLGRLLARRDTLALTDREIAAAGRPWCEPIDVAPRYAPRNGSSAEDLEALQ